MSRLAFFILIITSVLLLLEPANAQADKSQEGFERYIQSFKEEAIVKGYDASFLDRVFTDATFRQRVVTADKNQPERKLTLDTYLATRVPDWKVQTM